MVFVTWRGGQRRSDICHKNVVFLLKASLSETQKFYECFILELLRIFWWSRVKQFSQCDILVFLIASPIFVSVVCDVLLSIRIDWNTNGLFGPTVCVLFWATCSSNSPHNRNDWLAQFRKQPFPASISNQRLITTQLFQRRSEILEYWSFGDIILDSSSYPCLS